MELENEQREPREFWVVVNQNGQGSIEAFNAFIAECEGEREAIEHAQWADDRYPDLAPHVVIKVREVEDE